MYPKEPKPIYEGIKVRNKHQWREAKKKPGPEDGLISDETAIWKADEDGK